MNVAMHLLSLTRPVTMLIVLGIVFMEPGLGRAAVAVLAVSAAFFLASSAIISEWIRTSDRVRSGVLLSEIIVATVLSLLMTAWNNGSGEILRILFCPILVTIPLVLERRYWRPVYLLTIVSWVLASLVEARFTGYTRALVELGAYSTLWLFFASAGYAIRTISDERIKSEKLLNEVTESRAALERAHRQLQESAFRQQQMAVLEERQRLAREIHDSVAHGLTALVVQIQAARRVFEKNPAVAFETISRCEEMAREALQDTRRAVRALHPAGLEQQTEVEALRRLARDYGIATGMEIEVDVGAGFENVPHDPQRLEQLYRIAQEALTNAHRHGHAGKVEISLAFSGDDLYMAITNNGDTPCTFEPGVGLRSMTERAHAIGGTMHFYCEPWGATVMVIVPVEKEATSA